MRENKKNNLPLFFKPILWSYDFENLDLKKNKKVIVINAINYGDLKHWRWVAGYYGKQEIKKILAQVPFTEIRPRVVPLVSILFSINKFNYAVRGNT